MKLYAQHGYGEGDKINKGLEHGIISGVIYGAKDISPVSLNARLNEISTNFSNADRLFDPQYYVTTIASDPNIRLGKLEDYPYFNQVRRSRLEDSKIVFDQIQEVLRFQVSLPVNYIIAPNIFIPNSLNSIEAVIAKNFIRKTKEVYNQFSDNRPIYATLAISREALINTSDFDDFIDEITLLESPPDGFYLLIGARSVAARSDIFNTDVISAWMFLNYAFKNNGYKVINGYSDLVSPFLGAVGGDVGCTGWWSNLRTFSLERFAPEATGGRLPVQRYFSTKLLNRITFFELDALRRHVPEIVNGLSFDSEYEDEPDRSIEVLQSWEALDYLSDSLTNGRLEENIINCINSIELAEGLYASIKSTYTLDPKSDDSHLESLKKGIVDFKERAEI